MAEVRKLPGSPAKSYAYLYFPKFNSEMFNLLQSAVTGTGFRSDGLIIDLRMNEGGSIPILDRSLSLLFRSGTPLYYTSDRYALGGPDPLTHVLGTYVVSSSTVFSGNPEKPVVVLIDGNSYSSAEMFASALKFNRRAVIVGSPSAGRANISCVYALPCGSGLKISIAQFLTLEGRPLEKCGLAPDIRVDLSPEDISGGRDPALAKAEEALLGQILIRH